MRMPNSSRLPVVSNSLPKLQVTARVECQSHERSREMKPDFMWLKMLDPNQTESNMRTLEVPKNASSSHSTILAYGLEISLVFIFWIQHFRKHLQKCDQTSRVGGFNPSQKYESTGMSIPNIWKNKNVPNHQPVRGLNPHHPQRSRIAFFRITMDHPRHPSGVKALKVKMECQCLWDDM